MPYNDRPTRIMPMAAFWLVALCWTVLAMDIPDSPPTYVVDMAGVIHESIERDLNGYLQELEQKTTVQMIVLTLASLEGAEIRDFALTLAHDKWKLGQQGKDNGLLLLVAVKDRKYTIEIGYGLEGIIPDSMAGEIGRGYLAPYFRKNDYSTGIYTGVLALVYAIARDAGVTISGMPRVSGFGSGDTRKKSSGPLGKIGTVLFFISVLYLFIRHPRAFLTLLLLSSMGSGGRRGDWGGGGGGFGGFGGGGGGGFGGGGASGSW